MKEEKACGTIVEKDGKILLVYSNKGFWGFPKGHVEEGETETETAVRETFEETGVWVTPDEENRFEFDYVIADKNVHKIVVLFTAKIVDDTKMKKQDEEIADLRFVPKDDVEGLLTFAEWKDVWRRAKEVL
jgi:8-oxo-dGTP pyrophosphatase MutT (NUDIX family)